MNNDILAQVETPKPLQLDMTSFPKGINNYHTDICLSVQFCNDLRRLVKTLVQQESSFKQELREHEESFVMLRKSYLDMMTVLIHRIKTDLSSDEINFLQFSVPKFVLLTIKQNLDKFIEIEREKSSELRNYGSGKVLTVHEHLTWLSKNFNSIYYEISKQIFTQLLRVETKYLKTIRKQYLDQSPFDFLEILYNPMLMTRDINLPLFLVEHHLYWRGRADANEFSDLNLELERIFENILPELGPITLQAEEKRQSSRGEAYDDLGGLTLIKKFLGPVLSPNKTISEELCWADSKSYINFIFDTEKLKDETADIRQKSGLKAWLHSLMQIKKAQKATKKITRLVKSRGLFEQFIATFETRKHWNRRLSKKIEAQTICLYLSSSISKEKLLDKVFSGQELTTEEISTLDNAQKQVSNELTSPSPDTIVKVLMRLANFRLQLKQYRFAHRIFNHINLLTNPDEILLSKQATTLYQLPVATEIEEGESKIVHHCILKADIRGSTHVMHELENSGLNPASYFSLRFFGPINKILASYGANKVFIEGDAIILSFLEHEHSPQQWYSVAYACGLARALLSIIKASNRYSKEIGLPLLELGIGICYSNDRPRFLYDGDQPIMISSTIAQAGKEASCAQKLKKYYKPELFNVNVFEIDENEADNDENSQHYIRYNVNGIMLHVKAFEKLKSEVNLRKVSVVNDDNTMSFYYGEYSDTEGKRKDIIIREGEISLWKNNSIHENNPNKRHFYEVVSNSYLISLVRENISQAKKKS